MMEYIQEMQECCFNMAGMKVEYGGQYGAWQPNFESPITATMVNVYKEIFQEDAQVQVCHAGLECSIIGGKYPQMDLVSFGPTLRSPHTPDERCNIPSVEKFWIFLQALLAQIPEK
jgi:dipeptidase D